MLRPAVREGDGTLELTELGRHAIRLLAGWAIWQHRQVRELRHDAVNVRPVRHTVYDYQRPLHVRIAGQRIRQELRVSTVHHQVAPGIGHQQV